MTSRKRSRTVVQTTLLEDHSVRFTWTSHGVLHTDDPEKPSELVVSSRYKRRSIAVRREKASYLAYHRNGRLHNPTPNQPAEVWHNKWIVEAHWVNGKRHRDNHQPAVVYEDGSGDLFVDGWYQGTLTSLIDRTTLVWYRSRQENAGIDRLGFQVVHRDSDEPAIILFDRPYGELGCSPVYCAYYRHNEYHREGDLPAQIDFVMGVQQWMHCGKHHRNGDQPAVINEQTGRKEWWINGVLHRDDNPCVVDPQTGYWEWRKNGQAHRVDGAWCSALNEWKYEGRLHREGGLLPAYETPERVEHRVFGKFYCPNAPALIVRSKEGEVYHEEWYMTPGFIHRTEGKPAQSKYRDGKLIVEQWYEKPGMLHRENDLPAIVNHEMLWNVWMLNGLTSRVRGPANIRLTEDMAPRSYYYLDGVQVSEKMHRWIVDKMVRNASKKYKKADSNAGRELIRVEALYGLLV